MELVIGNKATSSWSLRPWLVLRRAGAPFRETPVALRRPDTPQAIRAAGSPSGKVPVLKANDGLVIWDSLAICEWAAERWPEASLWPADPAGRALARAATAEMHAGFAVLRADCAMDLRLRTTLAPSPALEGELRRLAALWLDLRRRFTGAGPFLCGGWSIADAFYTPVATRLRSYGLDLASVGDDGTAAAYAEALLQTPEFLEWERDALG